MKRPGGEAPAGGQGAGASGGGRGAGSEEVGGAWDERLREIERAVGYAFRDRSLLARALTHSSYRNEDPTAGGDNERLEFLGDAVLELTVSEVLFRRWPDYPEGRLTRLRASLVNTQTLAQVSRELGLGRALRLGRGEEATGGRDRRSTLADAYEATLGAVYLDAGESSAAPTGDAPPGGGLAAARAVVERTLMPRMEALAHGDGRDTKTRLQEWAQEHVRATPTYEIVDRQGPDHAVLFTARVVVPGVGEAEGRGRRKKEAHREAAAALLERLTSPPTSPTAAGPPGPGGGGPAADAALDGDAPAE